MRPKILVLVLPVLLFASCMNVHNDKFGASLNKNRKELGIPVINDGWERDAVFYFPAPENRTLWFTDERPSDLSLPYHSYKTIYYKGDTLIAETDTYLNMNNKWFGLNDDTLKNTFSKYHAIMVTYVYLRVNAVEKNFADYTLGFTYEIQGEKNGYSDIQKLNLQQAEAILAGWNLKRLN